MKTRPKHSIRKRQISLNSPKNVFCIFAFFVVDKAAKTYMICAKYEDDPNQIPYHFVEAAMCKKKVNTSEAVKILERAVDAFRFSADLRSVYITMHTLRPQTT